MQIISILGLTLLALFAVVACSPAPVATASAVATPSARPAPQAVSMKGFAFLPAALEVARGTSVTWTNEDSQPHTVTSGNPPPVASPAASAAAGASPAASRTPGPSPTLPTGDGRIESGRIETAKTFTFTFNTAGTFAYFCAVHPRMVATITVK